MSSTKGNLGVTMALPPGTLSQMESLRAEELKRREIKQQQQQQQQQSQSQQPPRRLAPQRKKQNPSSSFATDKNSFANNNNDGGTSERLPIQIPIAIGGEERNDDIVGAMFDDYDGGDENRYNNTNNSNGDDDHDDDGQVRIIARTMADWRIDEHDNTNEDEASEEEEDEEEYHGEIESDEDNQSDQESSVMEQHQEEAIDEGYALINEESMSLDPPPPTHPLVLVNLEALCGCPPADEAEKQMLVSQLMEALLGCSSSSSSSPSSPSKVMQSHGSSSEEMPQQNNGMTKQQEGDGLSLDFDARVVELFDSGVASHVDSSSPIAIAVANSSENIQKDDVLPNNTNNSNAMLHEEKGQEGKEVDPFAIVPYPEFLSSQQQQQQQPSSTANTRSTARLWKLLHTPHTLPLLTHLFTHLRNTSRSLLWKADMHQELRRLALQEHKAQRDRIQMEEYTQWKESARKERLERLYEVRETFVMRVDVAKRKYEVFVEERERRVKRELWRKRGGRNDDEDDLFRGEAPFSEDMLIDTGENVDYDDDGWGGVIREEDILGEDSDDDYDVDGDYDVEDDNVQDDPTEVLEKAAPKSEETPLGMSVVVSGNENTTQNKNDDNEANASAKVRKPRMSDTIIKKLEPITVSDNQQRKNKRIEKLKDQTNTKSKTHEFLKTEEELIREMLKTNDERMAEAALRSLEQRMQSVDELLESLQEEQWEDEEEAEERGEDKVTVDDAISDNGDEAEMNLLDQILAMILGGLSKESSGAKTDAEHFKYIKDQHASIVKEWKETFGRLPSFPSSEPELDVEADLPQAPYTMDQDFEAGYGGFLSADTFERQPETQKSSVKFSNKTTMLGNFENDNWDEVEDWDALLP